MAKNSSKDIAFKSGAQWLYQEMQQKLGDKPIEEVDPHIKAEATKRKANEYMVMMSIANIKNSVREYYRVKSSYKNGIDSKTTMKNLAKKAVKQMQSEMMAEAVSSN